MVTHRIFRWFLVLSLLAISLGVAQPRRAYACSCAYTPGLSDVERVLESFNRTHNQIVFVGTPVGSVAVQKSRGTISSDDPVFVTFAVESVYRGVIAPRFTVTTPRDDAMCGAHFAEGTRYLVFAGDDFNDGSWDTNLCAGNVDNPTNVVLAALGEGNAPNEQGERGEAAPEPPATGVLEENKAPEPPHEANTNEAMPVQANGRSQTVVTRWLGIAVVLALLGVALIWRFGKRTTLLSLLLLFGWPLAACNGAAQPEPSVGSNPADALVGQWVLAAAGDEASDMFLPDPPAQLTFGTEADSNGDAGMRFEGFSGCNSLFGIYRVEGNTLEMTIGLTEMFCNDGSSEFEAYMVDVLSSEPTFTVASEGNDTFLTIQHPEESAGRLLFRRQSPVEVG